METILDREIKGLLDEFPEVGRILDAHGVGCVSCSVGTCLVRDIVDIHNLDPEEERAMFVEIASVVYPGQAVEIPQRARETAPEAGTRAFSPPLAELVAEHVHIKRLGALLPGLLPTIDLQTDEGRQTALDCLGFIRAYADRFHHAKEEDILFGYFGEALDILKVMRQDHETGREAVRNALAAVERHDGAALSQNLLAWAALLAEHIKKEDEILYPWMDRLLTDRQVGEMFARFRRVDSEAGEAPRRYEAFVAALGAKLEQAATA